MKARIKSTGEWVELTDTVAYKEPETMECKETINGRIIPIHDLEFEQPIDWEQRRYEIAKAALHGLLTMPIDPNYDSNIGIEELAHRSVAIADEFIKQLKQQDNERD